VPSSSAFAAVLSRPTRWKSRKSTRTSQFSLPLVQKRCVCIEPVNVILGSMHRGSHFGLSRALVPQSGQAISQTWTLACSSSIPSKASARCEGREIYNMSGDNGISSTCHRSFEAKTKPPAPLRRLSRRSLLRRVAVTTGLCSRTRIALHGR
jgi:hypothetical protein